MLKSSTSLNLSDGLDAADHEGTGRFGTASRPFAKPPLRRVLLVEDDLDIQEVTTLLLGIAGFEVRACGSAAEALQSAPAFTPDLILLDFMMPGLDGQGAFAAFRQLPATSSTPVIFLTARVQPREIMEYRQLGSLGVIPKPFDPDTLAETIQGMWDRYQTARLMEARRKDLARLRRLYAADLPERLRAIEEAAAVIRDKGWDGQVAASLFEMAHRLAGSAAIYGFAAVSDAAQRIGRFATEHAPGWAPLDPRPLLKLVDDLERSLGQDGSSNV
jgi:CheY-like chemotaxis protein